MNKKISEKTTAGRPLKWLNNKQLTIAGAKFSVEDTNRISAYMANNGITKLKDFVNLVVSKALNNSQ